MKKKNLVLIVIALLSVFLIASLFKYMRNTSVQNSIKRYVKHEIRLNKDSEVAEDVRLADLTSFTWDYVVIYHNVSSDGIINKKLGFHWNNKPATEGRLDMGSGIIFVKNNDVVHEEILATMDSSAGLRNVIMQPYVEGETIYGVTRLNPDEAVFDCYVSITGHYYVVMANQEF